MRILIFGLLLLFCGIVNAQSTYVPDDNFEQALIDYGYDDILDNYVLTANIANVTFLDIQYRSIVDLTGLEDFASLTGIDCSSNQITNITFHNSVNLYLFICNNNPITDFDLSQHTNLDEFGCSGTNITSLDVSQNVLLHYLYCQSTAVTTLDLSNNPQLREVHGNSGNFQYVDVRNGNNQIMYPTGFKFNNNPNLPYIYVDDCVYSTINWTIVDPDLIFLEMEGQTECEGLSVTDFSDTDFQLFPNPTKNTLNIQSKFPIENVEIYSPQGVLINEYISNTIDVSQLSTGIYFVEVTVDGNSATKKFIKV